VPAKVNIQALFRGLLGNEEGDATMAKIDKMIGEKKSVAQIERAVDAYLKAVQVRLKAVHARRKARMAKQWIGSVSHQISPCVTNTRPPGIGTFVIEARRIEIAHGPRG